jgi:hypothetical protein
MALHIAMPFPPDIEHAQSQTGGMRVNVVLLLSSLHPLIKFTNFGAKAGPDISYGYGQSTAIVSKELMRR